MADKNKAMIAFLQTYNPISSKTLFFNYGNVENDAHQMISGSDDVNLQKPYIDGSVLKRYTVTVDSFKSVAPIPVVGNNSAENVDDLKDVQDFMDWVNAQGDLGNYPDFGEDCIIEDMATSTEMPQLIGVQDKMNPPIAIYRVTIQIRYIDTSKRLWS